MKAITKYLADDGSEFAQEADCKKYEAMCEQVQQAMSKLEERPSLPGCGFVNGDGYLQHDTKTVAEVRVSLLNIANSAMPHKWFEQSLADPSVHASWAGRLIGEMGYPCLWKGWDRIVCITSAGREYGQPYFANHPHEAKDVCLNKVQA